MDEKLKPCPFCGATDQYIDTIPIYRVACEREAYVFCRNCHARGPMAGYGESMAEIADARAAKKWNRRTAQDGEDRQ